MRVLFEEEVRALLAAPPCGGATGALCYLVDLHLPGAALSGKALRSVAEGVLRQVAERRAGWLDLAIFGQEPLRELEGVVALSRGLQRACLAWGVGYAAHVLVEGALLDAAAARELAQVGVARLQVGLEVPRRARRDRGWLRVLDAVAQAWAGIRLVLRVNSDPTCDLEVLVEALEERGLPGAGPAVALYLARRAPSVQQARELVALSALLEAGPASGSALIQ